MALRYENFIIENTVEEYLKTKLGMSQFLTVDSSLAGEDGMIKKIHKYTKTGAAETVAEGQGNTNELDVNFVEVPYTVTTSQVKWHYTDEAAMTDSYYVDRGIEAIAQSLVNEYNELAIAEFETCTNIVYTGDSQVDFDDFVDATASLNLEDAEEAGYFGLINPKMKGILRKSMRDDLKYVEAYARTGYVGSVAGIPLYTSKLVADGEVIIADKKAVTCFMKKNVEAEQDRDADKRTNYVWGRNVKLIALTDEDHCVLIKTGTRP